MSKAKEGAPSPAAAGKNPSSSVRLNRADLRRHPRFRADEANPQLYVKGFLTKLGIGRANEARSTVNLSEGGVLLLTNTRLKAGSPVQVRIEIEKYKDIIEAEGVVRWCFPSARARDDFYAGIEFRGLAAAQAA